MTMKKLTLLFAGLFLTGFLLSSCTEECKNCKTVTTDSTSGSVVSEGTSSEYCEEELDAVENEAPATVGNNTSRWVCE